MAVCSGVNHGSDMLSPGIYGYKATGAHERITVFTNDIIKFAAAHCRDTWLSLFVYLCSQTGGGIYNGRNDSEWEMIFQSSASGAETAVTGPVMVILMRTRSGSVS